MLIDKDKIDINFHAMIQSLLLWLNIIGFGSIGGMFQALWDNFKKSSDVDLKSFKTVNSKSSTNVKDIDPNIKISLIRQDIALSMLGGALAAISITTLAGFTVNFLTFPGESYANDAANTVTLTLIDVYVFSGFISISIITGLAGRRFLDTLVKALHDRLSQEVNRVKEENKEQNEMLSQQDERMRIQDAKILYKDGFGKLKYKPYDPDGAYNDLAQAYEVLMNGPTLINLAVAAKRRGEGKSQIEYEACVREALKILDNHTDITDFAIWQKAAILFNKCCYLSLLKEYDRIPELKSSCINLLDKFATKFDPGTASDKNIDPMYRYDTDLDNFTKYASSL